MADARIREAKELESLRPTEQQGAYGGFIQANPRQLLQKLHLSSDVGKETWSINENDFPKSGNFNDVAKFLLNYTILAPSAFNTQPWLFTLENNKFINFFADRTKGLSYIDPDDRFLTLSIGAAICNFNTAARKYGYNTYVTIRPESGNIDLLARIELGKPNSYNPTDADLALFRGITKSASCYESYEKRSIPDNLINNWKDIANQEGSWLKWFSDEREKLLMCELIAKGELSLLEDSRWRREFASWAHPLRVRTRDGLPGFRCSIGKQVEYTGQEFYNTFKYNNAFGKAVEPSEIKDGSPGLCILGSSDDTVDSWLRAGQTLQYILLSAASNGILHSWLNQPLFIENLRTRVRDLIGEYTGEPLIVLRFGYFGGQMQHTARRKVEDILLQ